jgi:hypothetical protein
MRTRRAQSVRSPLPPLFAAAAVATLLLLTTCGGGGGGGVGPTLTIITSSLPDAIIGETYNQTLSASGGTPPYTWTLASGSAPPPPGLTLSSQGHISGMPEPQGAPVSFDFTVVARDSASRSAQAKLRIVVVKRLEVITSTLPDGNVGVFYFAWLYGGGGVGDWAWSLAPDSEPLPPGLELVGYVWQAMIRGTPTSSGTFSFTVQVKDSGNPGQTATRRLTLFLDDRLVIATTLLPFGVVAQPYREPILAYGGTRPYTWELTSGTLPSGLAFDAATGEVVGTPSQDGHFDISVRVVDSSTPPESASASVTLQIRPLLAIATNRLADGLVDEGYTQSLDVVGGRPPITLRVSSGSLPPGLTLGAGTNPEGQYFFVTGIPPQVGTFYFTLEATDSSAPPSVVTKDLSIRINTRLRFTTTSLPVGLEGDRYDATLSASGGVAPYRWGILYGQPLPQGLTLNPETGQLSGAPANVLNESLEFYVEDSSYPAQCAYRWLTLNIVGRLSITTSSLPPARAAG